MPAYTVSTDDDGIHTGLGAQFHENLVVFENPDYGNAIYVMFERWRQLSQSSRVDLLKARTSGYVRIIHRFRREP